jgi:hypothetical protein
MLYEKLIISGYFALSKGEDGKSHKWVKANKKGKRVQNTNF